MAASLLAVATAAVGANGLAAGAEGAAGVTSRVAPSWSSLLLLSVAFCSYCSGADYSN